MTDRQKQLIRWLILAILALLLCALLWWTPTAPSLVEAPDADPITWTWAPPAVRWGVVVGPVLLVLLVVWWRDRA